MTMTTLGCARCGAYAVDPSAGFCATCGASLQERPAPPPFPPPPAPAPYGSYAAPNGYAALNADGAPTAYAAPPTAYGAPNAWAPPPAGQWNGGWPSPTPTPTDGLGIASLVASLVWLLGLGSIAAVVLGHLARSKAKRAGRAPSGISLAGLIIGYVGTVMTAILITLAVIGSHMERDQLNQQSALRVDLKNASIAEQSFATDNDGAFTGDVSDLVKQGLVVTPGDTVQVVDAQGEHYCLRAENLDGSQAWYLDSADDIPTTAACS